MKVSRFLSSLPWVLGITLAVAVGCTSSGGSKKRADAGDLGEADGSTPDGGGEEPPQQFVSFTVKAKVVLSRNYPGQYHELFRAAFNAGATKGRLFARFCRDEACERPVALAAATVDGADDRGYYTYSTGFPKAVSVTAMVPPGSSYLQFVLDTQHHGPGGEGNCDVQDLSSCPGYLDTLQTEVASIEVNSEMIGGNTNPAPSTLTVTVEDGGTLEVSDTIYLGSIYFPGTDLWTPPRPENGKLLVSTRGDGWLNAMKIIDLTSYTIADDSYVLARDGKDYEGDVCGAVEGGGRLFVIGLTADFGAHVFELDPHTGLQVGTDSIAFIPHPEHSGNEADGPRSGMNAETYPWPCRGVYVEAEDGSEHLYLIQFKGAGVLDTSAPYPLYHVALGATPRVESLFEEYSEQAWRAIDYSGGKLYLAEMNWSRDNNDDVNKICTVAIGADGSVEGEVTCSPTRYKSEERCGGRLPLPSDMKVVNLGGSPHLVFGHDGGLAVFSLPDLRETQNLDLSTNGTLVSNLALSLDGSKLYATPQCKANTAIGWFELPYGSSTEKSDRNLATILDVSGPQLQVASTAIDPDGNGQMDNGIDLDFYFLKAFIRSFGPTLPIPPVVYTGPVAVVGEKSYFLRGTGIGGLGSSGLGQAQDISVFDLETGKGVIFREYVPFFHGLSAPWGFELGAADTENTVGILVYIR